MFCKQVSLKIPRKTTTMDSVTCSLQIYQNRTPRQVFPGIFVKVFGATVL